MAMAMHCPIWRHLAPATRPPGDAVWRRGETMKADKIVTECCGALLSSDNIKFHNEGACSCYSFTCGICGH